ncbi:MAG: FxLYD domain-containing protein [Clostridiales bacterium]|nr:FxLYD domain-containing protein [Clostridiales bacterium]
MKNKKLINRTCSCLLVAAFVLMSVASSSTKETTKVVVDGSDQISSDDGSGSGVTKETTASNEVSYEITDTRFNYYTNSIGNLEYYGIVEITNTGSSYLYMDDCTFDLEDNDGHLLQSDNMIPSCPDVIAPGEKGYFYSSIGSSSIDDGVSLDNGVKLVPSISVEVARGGASAIVEYDVSDTDLRTDDYNRPKVTGRVTNNTGKDNSYLYVNVLFYDSEGKIIAISGTTVTDLSAGATVSFECSTLFTDDSLTMDSIGSYEVIARDAYMQF